MCGVLAAPPGVAIGNEMGRLSGRRGCQKPPAHICVVSTLDDTLKRAIEIATDNPDAGPREVQTDLSHRIEEAMDDGAGHVCAVAPTGSGKSLAYLVPAALAAAEAGERTIVSTESLSLQAQIIEKDLPVVAEAVKETTGQSVSFAVLKGWSNYSCLLEAVTAARVSCGLDTDAPIPTTMDGLRKLADEAEAAMDGISPLVQVSGKDGAKVSARELNGAAVWAIRQAIDNKPGDRHSYPGAVDSAVWNSVSVSASDCLGSKCPLYDMCRPVVAKRKAAAAQIVVTNHTMLGIQAAKSIPAVLSSKSLGQFQHIIVDEAHGLPGVVRSQGASAVSSRRIASVRGSMNRLVEGWADSATKYLTKISGSRLAVGGSNTQIEAVAKTKKENLELIAAGFHVANRLDEELGKLRSEMDRGHVVKIDDESNPIEESAPMIGTWLTTMRRIVRDLTPVGYDMELSRNKARVAGKIDSLVDAVKQVSEHQVGTARWVEEQRRDRGPFGAPTLEAKATPVDVAGAISANLWTTDVIPSEDDEGKSNERTIEDLLSDEKDAGSKKDDERVPLSVTCVSATLPRGFTRDVAMHTKLVRFGSPLVDAYEGSSIYIPKLSPDDVAALKDKGSDRVKFSTHRHSEWSAPRIIELVNANQGSSLVLAATASDGRKYAESLRKAARGRWKVLSQWDGRLAGAVAAEWRNDHTAVLVGTRSYMTGLDAPGATCTLVVLDRPPRSASNPVDDARVEMLADAAEISRWDADRKVYVADATVLLEQAVGRLLRSGSDRGMVAVLDPRLLKNNKFSYQELTRNAYMSPIRQFGNKISNREKALAWLASQVELRASADGKVA